VEALAEYFRAVASGAAGLRVLHRRGPRGSGRGRAPHGEVGGLPDRTGRCGVTLVFRREGPGCRLGASPRRPAVHEITIEQIASDHQRLTLTAPEPREDGAFASCAQASRLVTFAVQHPGRGDEAARRSGPDSSPPCTTARYQVREGRVRAFREALLAGRPAMSWRSAAEPGATCLAIGPRSHLTHDDRAPAPEAAPPAAQGQQVRPGRHDPARAG